MMRGKSPLSELISEIIKPKKVLKEFGKGNNLIVCQNIVNHRELFFLGIT